MQWERPTGVICSLRCRKTIVLVSAAAASGTAASERRCPTVASEPSGVVVFRIEEHPEASLPARRPRALPLRKRGETPRCRIRAILPPSGKRDPRGIRGPDSCCRNTGCALAAGRARLQSRRIRHCRVATTEAVLAGASERPWAAVQTLECAPRWSASRSDRRTGHSQGFSLQGSVPGFELLEQPKIEERAAQMSALAIRCTVAREVALVFDSFGLVIEELRSLTTSSSDIAE